MIKDYLTMLKILHSNVSDNLKDIEKENNIVVLNGHLQANEDARICLTKISKNLNEVLT